VQINYYDTTTTKYRKHLMKREEIQKVLHREQRRKNKIEKGRKENKPGKENTTNSFVNPTQTG